MTGLSVKGLTPLTLPEGAIRKLTPEEQAAHKDLMLRMLEQQYSQPVDLENHPSQQVYATVKDKGGNVIATIYNGGSMATSNAMAGQLKGLPETGAQARAEWMAKKFGGKIEMASTAITDAQYAQTPPIRFQVDREALEADPFYQRLMGLLDDRETLSDGTRKALLDMQEV